MGKLLNAALNGIVLALATEGNRIITECMIEKEYQHDTFNLHDSYGYGVYVNGVLKSKGTLSKEATEGKKWYGETLNGRDEIERFLNEYEASKGIELVIAAAMPYAEALENASSGQHKTYKVISMSFDKLAELAQSNPKLKASVHAIIRGRRK